jgi:class 3 adenylate cyclase/TolB-like protein
MEQSKRRLAAIMFTDMVGYSALTHKDEQLADQLLTVHNSILREFFEKHEGREIKSTGDGFLVEFATALRAVKCAIEIQSSIQSHNLGVTIEKQIQVRIGIHLGEIEEKDNDIYGDGVNIASRIEGLCEPGGIAVSEAIFLQVENRFETPLISLGKQELKNIDKPLEVYRVSLPWQNDETDIAQVKAKRIDRRLKYGSVAAISVIALILAWFLWQTVSGPSIPQLVMGEDLVIAVLPFDDLSPNQDSEYFARGLAVEVLNNLSTLPHLKVIDSESGAKAKELGLDISSIGSALDAAVVVTGSIRKQEDDIRVTVRVFNAINGSLISSNNYDRDLENIFEIQEEIAREVASSVRLDLDLGPNERLVAQPTQSSEAFDLYLKGQHFLKRQNYEDFQRALGYFQDAIALDPGFAAAYVGLSSTYNTLSGTELFGREEGLQLAEESIELAINIDPTSSNAYARRSSFRRSNGDLEGAMADLNTAFDLNPNEAEAYYRRAFLLFGEFGKIDEAVDDLRMAVSLNPLADRYLRVYGQALLAVGELQEAIKQFESAVELEPESIFSRRDLLIALRMSENWEHAREIIERGLILTPSDPNMFGIYAEHLVYEDAFADSVEQLKRALDIDSQHLRSLGILQSVYRLNYQWEEAKLIWNQIMQLNPSAQGNIWGHAKFQLILGEKEEAEDSLLTMLSIAVDTRGSQLDLGRLLRLFGRNSLALEKLKRSQEIRSGFELAAIEEGLIYLEQFKFAEALRLFEGSDFFPLREEDEVHNLMAKALIGFTSAKLERNEEAEAILHELIGQSENIRKPYLPIETAKAIVYMGLGQIDLVFESLELAIDDHDSNLQEWLLLEPLFEDIRSDARYEAMVERIGLVVN